MSIRHGLLALLTEGPKYGAALRSEFEARTGGTWPLNVGQVYSTLSRLERDGLVSRNGEDDATIRYAVTKAGRAEVERWWREPVDRANPPRHELVIKLSLAVTVPGVDVPGLVQTQRRATVQHMQELTRLKRAASRGAAAGGGIPGRGSGAGPDLAWSLVLEHLIFAAESELRWLDHVEGALAQASTVRTSGTSSRWRGEPGPRTGTGSRQEGRA